ncbi:MAG: hypothetical protein R3C11_01930 [Planctomycetaceae bacterium]
MSPQDSSINSPTRRIVMTLAGGAVLFYVVLALGYVATSPDLRLRFLLLDEKVEPTLEEGIRIRETLFESEITGGETDQSGTSVLWGAEPEKGDWLQTVDGQTIRNYYDYSDVMSRLYQAPLSHNLSSNFPAIQQPGENDEPIEGRRTVEIEIRPRQDSNTILKSKIHLQSVPSGNCSPCSVGYLCKSGFCDCRPGCLVPSLRPFFAPLLRDDHLHAGGVSGDLLLVDSIHTSLVAGSLCIVRCIASGSCAAFLSGVPAPQTGDPTVALAGTGGIYTIPVLSAVVFLSLWGYGFWLHYQPAETGAALMVVNVLHMVRVTIYSYVGVATIYFLCILLALAFSFYTTRNPLEKQQVRVILGAGLFSTVMLCIALWLATVDKEQFAHGSDRILSANVEFSRQPVLYARLLARDCAVQAQDDQRGD